MCFRDAYCITILPLVSSVQEVEPPVITIFYTLEVRYFFISKENMSKFYRFKRATRTFGDLSKREIKELIRNGRSSGFDWFSER